MYKNIPLLLLMSLEFVFVHLRIFPNVDTFGIITTVIFFQGLLFSIFLITFSRKIIVLVSFIELLIFIMLLTYHKYYVDPLKIKNILDQCREGADFASKSSGSFIILPNIILIISFFIKISFLYFLHNIRKTTKIKLRIICAVPLLVYYMSFWSQFYKKPFFEIHFSSTVKIFGYPSGWSYELSSVVNSAILANHTKKSSDKDPIERPAELKDISLPNNIFLVQVESLDYDAVFSKKNNKKLMPYVSSLCKKSICYKIIPHKKQESSNFDYCTLTRSSISENLYSVAYTVIPSDFYSTITTLPRLMSSQGYKTYFYHGYQGRFFNRRANINEMGFDEVWFEEDFPAIGKKGEWGYEDKDLFKYILNNIGKESAKNFNFIITVSGHEEFSIGKYHNTIIPKPKNMEESYYNTTNYVDIALQYLVENAPGDSLFIIYSDHHSSISKTQETIMLVYDKRKYRSGGCNININQAFEIIKSMF